MKYFYKAKLFVILMFVFNSALASQSSCVDFYSDNNSTNLIVSLLPKKAKSSEKSFHPIEYKFNPHGYKKEVSAYFNGVIDTYKAKLSESPEYKIVVRFLESPTETLNDFKQRFDVARKQFGNGYLFNFADVGNPILKAIKNNLDPATAMARKKIQRKSFLSADDQLVLNYLTDFQTQLSDVLGDSSKQTYLRVTHLSHYFARLVGYLNENGYLVEDSKQQVNYRRKLFLWIDRRINGYRVRNIKNEYTKFSQPINTLADIVSFDEKSLFLTTSNKYSDAFVYQLSRQDSLPFVLIPSSLFLGRDVFYMSLAHGFNIYGVTYDPIFADGFYRPAGDFLVHDYAHIRDISITHEIAIQKLMEENGRNREQLTALMSKNTKELIYEISLLERQAAKDGHPVPSDFKNAVDFLAFNIHHDRGYPTSPSGYWHETTEPSLAPYFLHLSQKFGGQFEYYGETEFRNYKPRLKEARNWLNQFWASRIRNQ